MRKVESLTIKYVGYGMPESEEEIDLEVLGLKTAIAAANQRISVLKQSLQLREIMKNFTVEDTKDEETVQETHKTEETK